MAMRQKLYEDIVPKSQWKDQPEATLLNIDLPGFTKDQIKVTYVNASNMLRVIGERPVTDRRWSRFSEVFTVPENCLADKIHGSFKNNVLTITFPKETITKTAYLPEDSKVEKRLMEEARRREKEEDDEFRKKLLEEREGLIKKLKEEEAKAEAMRKLREEEARAKEKAEALRKLKEEEAKAKEKAEVMRRLQEEEAKAKEKAVAMRKLQEEEAKAREKAEVMRKLEAETKAKEKVDAMRNLEQEVRVKESPKKRKLVGEAMLGKKSVYELRGKEKKLPEVVYTRSGPEGVREAVELGEEKSGYMNMMERVKKTEKELMEKMRGKEAVKPAEEKLGSVVEKVKKTEKELMEKIRGNEMTSEEKKLMVNVGMAAIVIFALGAYVSYTISSSSS